MKRSSSSETDARRIPASLSAVVLTAALGEGCAAAVSIFLLKRLDAVLRFLGPRIAPGEEIVETLSRVFSALRSASIRPRVLLPFLPALAAAALLLLGSGLFPRRSPRPGRLRILFSAAGWVILSLAALLLTLWLAEVNGIRFGDVALSLVRTVRSGALDAL